MRKLVYIFLSLVFLNCTSQKKLTEDTSFEMGKAVCQKWVGGKEVSGSGMELMIVVNFPEDSSVVLKELFFRGKQVPATLFTDMDNTVIKAEIPSEAENSAETIGLNLEPTEAVLSYLENETLKYTKITSIKEIEPLLYNSRPKN